MDISHDTAETLRRKEPREVINEFYSVEMTFDDTALASQYIIYDISSEGLCLLVREGEELLEKIEVGGIYKMKYYPLNLLESVQYLRTRIRHITRPDSKKFSGHYLVGLSIQPEMISE